jgi:hypothetical protein
MKYVTGLPKSVQELYESVYATFPTSNKQRAAATRLVTSPGMTEGYRLLAPSISAPEHWQRFMLLATGGVVTDYGAIIENAKRAPELTQEILDLSARLAKKLRSLQNMHGHYPTQWSWVELARMASDADHSQRHVFAQTYERELGALSQANSLPSLSQLLDSIEAPDRASVDVGRQAATTVATEYVRKLVTEWRSCARMGVLPDKVPSHSALAITATVALGADKPLEAKDVESALRSLKPRRQPIRAS